MNESTLKDVCPRCHGSDWKTARMVVLEGTTFSAGELEGQSTSPGRISGPLRNFFLADRWFALDSKIEADLQFTTTSALVVKIRELLLAKGDQVRLPPEPVGPSARRPEEPRIGWLERVRPVEPTKPVAPTLQPLPADRSWPIRFIGGLMLQVFPLGLLLVLAIKLFGREEVLQLLRENLYVVSASVTLLAVVLASKVNKIAKSGVEEANQRLLTKHEKALRRYADKYQNFLADKEAARLQEEQHARDIEDFQRKVAAYEARMAKWEQERERVLEARDRLWDAARVCLRCSTAYFGAGTSSAPE